MEQLIQSSDLFVMQVEMDVYTALKKVEGKVTSFITPRDTHCTIRLVLLALIFFSLCSGCFCSSIHRGTAPSSSFWLTPMPGYANAGLVLLSNILNEKFFLLVATDRCLTLFSFNLGLQTCVRESPS